MAVNGMNFTPSSHVKSMTYFMLKKPKNEKDILTKILICKN